MPKPDRNFSNSLNNLKFNLHKKIIQSKKPAVFFSGNKAVFAENPTDSYTGGSITKFIQFTKKHQKKLLIGYLSYDISYDLLKIPQNAKNGLKLPKIYFQAFPKWESFTLAKTHTVMVSSTSVMVSPSNHDNAIKNHFHPTTPKSTYVKTFWKIRKYIKQGEIYQVNYTHRLHSKSKLSGREIFLRLLQTNKVPHLAYLEGPNFEIISASPERFIKIENRTISTYPIKGTIPISKDPKELMDSQKEAAELNMITDLLRNDLGKVSETGTVKVRAHRRLQKCPTVWHTYSKITGRLRQNLTPLEALISMFPGGSITGCPKKRAVEIIDEIEPDTRGVYTGCIVCIHPQYLDSSIVIRTIIKKGQDLYLQVGGGITYDSTVEKEYQETLDKAASFMNILD
ncbi:anthranilate synthase component I family protein [Candidatus Peregrinibacteria bacterium]|nr:anthranilate synthase component I family protein [Candidatus Peregrinibacteria bacterium]